MILDFNKIEEKALANFKGGEKALNAKMNVDENNKILGGRLEPGASIGEHTHETNSEIIFFGIFFIKFGRSNEKKAAVCIQIGYKIIAFFHQTTDFLGFFPVENDLFCLFSIRFSHQIFMIKPFCFFGIEFSS